MAFDTSILAGGLVEIDPGVIHYRRVLAIRESVEITIDGTAKTAFDNAFTALFGFDGLAGMQAHARPQQERIALWARMKLLELRAIEDGGVEVDPAGSGFEGGDLFYKHYEDQWMFLDDQLLWQVVLATEAWYALTVRGVSDSGLADLVNQVLGGSGSLVDTNSFDPIHGFGVPVAQLQKAVSLVRLFETDYEDAIPQDVLEMEDHLLDLDNPQIFLRMTDANYVTHLHLMGWLAEGLQTVTLDDQRLAFNAFSQTDFGDTAIAPEVEEMVELFRKLATLLAASSGLRHDLLIHFAEIVAHGYAPEALFQAIDFLPGEVAPGTPGAIWIEVLDNPTNAKTVECELKVFVPAGVEFTALKVELVHKAGNPLLTRYANADGAVADEADHFFVSNLDENGIGKTKFEALSDSGLSGGSEGTVYTLGTFDLHYGVIGERTAAIAPRPYEMPMEKRFIEDAREFAKLEIEFTDDVDTEVSFNAVILQNPDKASFTTLVAGTDFAGDGDANAQAAALAAAIDALDGYEAEATTNEVEIIALFNDPAPVRFDGPELLNNLGLAPNVPADSWDSLLTGEALGGFTTVDGNTITLPDLFGGSPHVLEAGVDFPNGATAGSAAALGAAIAAAMSTVPGYTVGYHPSAGFSVSLLDEDTGEPLDHIIPPLDPITLVGSEIIADFGASEFAVQPSSFAADEDFDPPVDGDDVSSAFVPKGLRILAGLRNDGGRNYQFPI